jgi:hypothetical protein
MVASKIRRPGGSASQNSLNELRDSNGGAENVEEGGWTGVLMRDAFKL